ncbi:MAG: hypothetical protein NTV49_10115 [Kiritimatiellaeota bacterium]|nr:hypothetical protein [Kiritimatiellota bacterium]
MRKYSFSDYTVPQVYAVSEKLARQAVVRAGGRVEKDANGEEVFVIPVQTPKPGALERSWEPGPIANTRFTPEEVAEIKGVAAAERGSLLAGGRESRSRRGNQDGSINDGDLGSIVVTFDGQPAAEDWFAVTLAAPVAVRRVVFAHGKNFHNGGWFDASAGKPRVQIQREKNGAWATVGELADYPAATATDHKGLKPGQKFTLRLPAPVRAAAVRVLGTPVGGDQPQQAFSSCSELQAFAE